MIRVSGTGRIVARDPLDAQLAVIDELTSPPADEGIGVPFEVRTVPGPSPVHHEVGWAVPLLDQMYCEIGPHGWKLCDRPGRDAGAARAQRESHLSALEIALHGYRGPLTVGCIGPISLAAELYTARTDRVIADPIAARDLSYALAAGLREHIAQVRHRAPGVGDITVVFGEELFAPALVGALPNFSGMFRIRRLDRGAARELLDIVTTDLDADVVVNLGASTVGLDVLDGSAISAVGLDLPAWDESRWTSIAQVVDSGMGLWWGMPAPALSQCAGPQIVALADQLFQPWRRIGLSPQLLDNCALVDRSAAAARELREVRDHLASLVRVSHILAERNA